MLWRVSRPIRTRCKPPGFILPCQPALADRQPACLRMVVCRLMSFLPTFFGLLAVFVGTGKHESHPISICLLKAAEQFPRTRPSFSLNCRESQLPILGIFRTKLPILGTFLTR